MCDFRRQPSNSKRLHRITCQIQKTEPTQDDLGQDKGSSVMSHVLDWRSMVVNMPQTGGFQFHKRCRKRRVVKREKNLYIRQRLAFFNFIPWGSKLVHACRKLLGNSFSGSQVMITCATTCQKFLGNFRPFQAFWIFITCFEFFYFLKFPLNSKIIWGAIFCYIGRLPPPCLPLSCFVLFVALHECIMKT